MGNIDKRNRLDEAPFSYRVNKEFLNKVNAAENDKALQLVMAKVTGNFKRGTERNNSPK